MPRIVLISYFHAKNKGKKEFQISDSKYTFTAWLFPVDGKIPPISHNKRNILGGKKSRTIAHHPCCHGERSPCSACESLFSLLHVMCSLFIFQRYFGPLKRNEPRAKLWVVALISNNYARARNHCETRTLPVARPSRFNGGNNPWKSPTPWEILRGTSWCFGLKMRI